MDPSLSSLTFEDEEPLVDAHAGLVLLWPLLPVLFDRTELLKDGHFVSKDAAAYALALLRYLAMGREYRASSVQADMPVARLLCGMESQFEASVEVPLSKEVIDLCDGMLQSAIEQSNWLGATSKDGFRTSFLLREGCVQRFDQGWQLVVQPAPFDMLLDKLPWSLSLLRLPWMTLPIHVEWR